MVRPILLTIAASAIFLAPAQEGITTKGVKARELFFTSPVSAKPSVKTDSLSTKAQQGGPQDLKKVHAQKVHAQKPLEKIAAETLPQRSEAERLEPVDYIPLGLRYSVMRRVNGQFEEVDPETPFRSNDAIRVKVEANDTGYLYIVMKGSSGNWRVMFPAPEVNEGSNRVAPGREYMVPSKSAFVFDEQPGDERLFLILTRQPEPDLERVIYALQGSGSEATVDEPKRMIASGRIDDSLVARMQGKVLARDLVFEKVEEEDTSASRTKKQTKIYVVNPSGAADSSLIANLTLKHH